MRFADLPEEDQIVRVTEALLGVVGPRPTPRDLRVLCMAALEIAQALQIALGDQGLPDEWVPEPKVVHAAYAWSECMVAPHGRLAPQNEAQPDQTPTPATLTPHGGAAAR